MLIIALVLILVGLVLVFVLVLDKLLFLNLAFHTCTDCDLLI